VSAVAKAGQGWNQTNLDVFRERFGAEIVPDRRYTIEFDEIVSPDLGAPANPDAPSLHDVLELIGAPAVWETSRGQGVTIAIVDTGIDGTRPEFPASRRMGGWSPGGEDPWSDWLGHGTMVACIAAGRQDGPGTFNGVAPDAQLIACRTEFYDTELTAIYDHLTELARTGQRVVASNSFGIVSAWPPSPEESLDFPAALADAIEAGVAVVFSAGNNHVLAQGGPEDDHPNTIWLYKARADVLTVGACKPDGRMWPYSSRGPGQDHELDGNGAKPDVVAPTPPGGMVAYGSQLHTFRNGWGTSGACAEAAGLIALLWSCRPELSSDELFEIVRSTARPIAAGINSQGSGCIDCAAAMGALSGG
jgi:serine protease AprX